MEEEEEEEKTGRGRERGKNGTRNELLACFQFGHFLHVDADALAVEQHEVDGLDGGRHRGHEVAGDGLQDELGRRLLREAVPGHTGPHTHTHVYELGDEERWWL